MELNVESWRVWQVSSYVPGENTRAGLNVSIRIMLFCVCFRSWTKAWWSVGPHSDVSYKPWSNAHCWGGWFQTGLLSQLEQAHLNFISLTWSPFCPRAVWKMNCSSTSIKEQEKNNPANMGLPTRTTRWPKDTAPIRQERKHRCTL